MVLIFNFLNLFDNVSQIRDNNGLARAHFSISLLQTAESAIGSFRLEEPPNRWP